jgi:hypothetical protein
VALEVRWSTPLQTASPLKQPPRKIHPGEELPRSSRSTLEQIPPWEILLLEPRLKRTRIGAIFVVKTTFKLKINIKRNPLNFKSIQWNHLQAFQSRETIPLKSTLKQLRLD